MLQSMQSVLAQHQLEGTGKEAPLLAQLAVRMLSGKANEDSQDGLLLLLNHLIPHVSPAFLQLSLDRLVPVLSGQLAKPHLEPSIVMPATAVALQLCKIFSDEDLSGLLARLLVRQMISRKRAIVDRISQGLKELIEGSDQLTDRLAIILAE